MKTVHFSAYETMRDLGAGKDDAAALVNVLSEEAAQKLNKVLEQIGTSVGASGVGKDAVNYVHAAVVHENTNTERDRMERRREEKRQEADLVFAERDALRARVAVLEEALNKIVAASNSDDSGHLDAQIRAARAALSRKEW